MLGARRGPFQVGLLWMFLLAGCVHFNAVYNARRLYTETERLRRAGLDSLSADAYAQVIAGARRGLEADDLGTWADDALLLIGQSSLRRRELTQARDALRTVMETTNDEDLRRVARMFQGAVAVEMGEPARAIALLDSVPLIFDRLQRGEGSLWRARALLAVGRLSEAWSDLDQARAAHPSLSVPGELLRLTWGVQANDTAAAGQALQSLMADSRARFFGDSIRATLDRGATLWGPASTVALMTGAAQAAWSRTERDELVLLRGRLAYLAGDTSAAFRDATRVAGGVGGTASTARIQLAHWTLAGVSQLQELSNVRELLLPSVASADARRIMNAIRRVEFLVDAGLDGEGIAYFAAAEQAREALGAKELASALYLAFTDLDRQSPWLVKALLAARELSSSPERLAAIEERLRRVPESAYLSYARSGETGEGLAPLEERLQSALTDLLGRVETELLARRLLLLDPDGTNRTSSP